MHVRRGLGTIPARAGSSSSASASSPSGRDHPRACGEQHDGMHDAAREAGPSPRVRGAGAVLVVLGDALGTIPARAGSRRDTAGAATSARDHPRACGEQTARRGGPRRRTGPSPRVRGAAAGVVPGGPQVGTIPARAGSSNSAVTGHRRGGDHPRACGEQGYGLNERRFSLGPSPRVRGADSVSCGFRREGRPFYLTSPTPALRVKCAKRSCSSNSPLRATGVMRSYGRGHGDFQESCTCAASKRV